MADGMDCGDVDFDEQLEIEKLQATIRSMANFSDDSEGFMSQSPEALLGDSGLAALAKQAENFDPYAALEKPAEKPKGPKPKKFVVMIEASNVEYFDSIPTEDRAKLFNKLLADHKKNTIKAKEKKHLIKFTKHMLVATFVILISLPIMFVIVNKSVQMTIKNYKESQNNFEQLYESRSRNNTNSVHRTIY